MKQIYDYAVQSKKTKKIYLMFKSGQDRYVLSNGKTMLLDNFIERYDIITTLTSNNYKLYYDIIMDKKINRRKSSLVTKYNPNTGCLIRTYADDNRFVDVPNV